MNTVSAHRVRCTAHPKIEAVSTTCREAIHLLTPCLPGTLDNSNIYICVGREKYSRTLCAYICSATYHHKRAPEQTNRLVLIMYFLSTTSARAAVVRSRWRDRRAPRAGGPGTVTSAVGEILHKVAEEVRSRTLFLPQFVVRRDTPPRVLPALLWTPLALRSATARRRAKGRAPAGLVLRLAGEAFRARPRPLMVVAVTGASIPAAAKRWARSGKSALPVARRARDAAARTRAGRRHGRL